MRESPCGLIRRASIIYRVARNFHQFHHLLSFCLQFLFAALQESSTQILSEVVTFLPADVENKKCIDISIVDDDVALEAVEEWTLRLQATENQNYELGDSQTAMVQVIDDDGINYKLV